mmetsp:Transcript_24272/g.61859  ORF Transcript_24272/g.61859 Transcript_24272/m.61859 type:complete len:600 (+) Transcript_24272:108-1907(+)
MQADIALRLAGDILDDHFGSAVRLVGSSLLARGPLSIQDLLRFTAEECTSTQQEPLRFHHVRNALLTLVQHGLVIAKPHPVASQSGDSIQSLKQVYTMDVEDVLNRLRFPKFLEYCFYQYGDLGYELMCVMLNNGSCTVDHAVREVMLGLRDVTDEELRGEFKRLVDERLLRAVEPAQIRLPAEAPASSSSSLPLPLAGAAVAEGVAVQAQGDPVPIANGDLGEVSGGASSSSAAKRPRVAGADGKMAVVGTAAPAPAVTVVYRYNRAVLDLAVFKGLICRLIEERIDSHAAQVITALLTAVRPKERGSGVDADFLRFPQIEKRMLDLGFKNAGRDPKREQAQLLERLSLLAAHKDGLLKRRSVTGPAPVSFAPAPIADLDADIAPASAAAGPGKRRRGPVGAAAAVPVVSGGARHGGDQPPVVMLEWCIDWGTVKKLLTNATTSQIIRDQFGTEGLRMFNLLRESSPPQKLEDKQIFEVCFVQPLEGREILNEMVRRSIVNWQEVPRGGGAPLTASFWLYYVDLRRLNASLLWNVLQAMLNLRVRFRLEVDKGRLLESRQGSLTKKEIHALKEGRRKEDIIERSFLVLDAALLIYRMT